jgi:hypothetical protein
MKKTPLAELLPDYGDRDFVLGVLHNYVLDYCLKYIEKNQDWYIEHAGYANDILKTLGGTGVDVEAFKSHGVKINKAKQNEIPDSL